MSGLPSYQSVLDDIPPCYDSAKGIAELNALSPEQKTELGKSVALASTGEDAMLSFRSAARDAAGAADRIELMFVDLTAKLMNLDSTADTDDFVEKFKVIQKHYRSVVSDSHELAITISQYGHSFDEVVIKFCADQSLTLERRLQKIGEFMDKGTEIKGQGEDMEASFNGLKDEFSGFVGTFSTWAQDREDEDNEKIKGIEKEIADIQKQIDALDAAIAALGALLGATLPITGILAALFPPLAPIIMTVGGVLAGLELTSLTGCLIAKNMLLNDKRQKEQEISNLQDEIEKIRAARLQLEKDGQTDLTLFSNNITAIAKIWVNVQNDATLINQWLKDGAADADVPEYMKYNLDQGAKVYKSMGAYLEDYANGVSPTVRRFKV